MQPVTINIPIVIYVIPSAVNKQPYDLYNFEYLFHNIGNKTPAVQIIIELRAIIFSPTSLISVKCTTG